MEWELNVVTMVYSDPRGNVYKRNLCCGGRQRDLIKPGSGKLK